MFTICSCCFLLFVFIFICSYHILFRSCCSTLGFVVITSRAKNVSGVLNDFSNVQKGANLSVKDWWSRGYTYMPTSNTFGWHRCVGSAQKRSRMLVTNTLPPVKSGQTAWDMPQREWNAYSWQQGIGTAFWFSFIEHAQQGEEQLHVRRPRCSLSEQNLSLPAGHLPAAIFMCAGRVICSVFSPFFYLCGFQKLKLFWDRRCWSVWRFPSHLCCCDLGKRKNENISS